MCCMHVPWTFVLLKVHAFLHDLCMHIFVFYPVTDLGRAPHVPHLFTAWKALSFGACCVDDAHGLTAHANAFIYMTLAPLCVVWYGQFARRHVRSSTQARQDGRVAVCDSMYRRPFRQKATAPLSVIVVHSTCSVARVHFGIGHMLCYYLKHKVYHAYCIE